jgi:uncharacterized protein (DUF1499 family)
MAAMKLVIWSVRIAALGLVLGVVAAFVAVGAGFGHRLGWWAYRDGFAVLGWVAWLGLGSVVISLLGLALGWSRVRGAVLMALIGVVLGGAVAWIPYQSRAVLRASVRLPDVTTDTVAPPAFVAAIEVRRASGARNSAEYDPDNAAVQARTYPDIAPVRLTVSPDVAFDRSVAVMRKMGLDLLAADKATGRIEATATTFWFGFKDDVVIRVKADPGGARVDIRSSSRVGGRDGGTNAARVRTIARRIGGG